MSFYELLLSSRSYRSFDRTAPVTRETLLHLVDCARLTPSSMNLQMLKYRLVDTEEECAALFPLTRWAGRIKDQKIPPAGHEPTAYVLICADRTVSPTAETFQKDVGIVAQTMMLAATEAGFGGCMIGSFDKNAAKELLGLSEDLVPMLLLALGKPDEEVFLTDAEEDIAYYRANGKHYTPKRTRDGLIV